MKPYRYFCPRCSFATSQKTKWKKHNAWCREVLHVNKRKKGT